MMHLAAEYDETSCVVDLSGRDLHGFCKHLTLRRHRDEEVSNGGIGEARRDWGMWIGPIETFANANPYDGSFTALTLPLTKRERLRVVSYFMEYAFLYDDVNESAAKALEMAKGSDDMIVDDNRSAEGAKKMQAKIIDDLFEIDQPGGQRILDKWKLCVTTVRELKQGGSYSNLEEYVAFRNAECGAPFVEALMLFGMAVHLTAEDDQLLEKIVKPAYAALGLTNDYFSFDREFDHRNAKRRDSMDLEPMTNAVWLCMQWHSLSIDNAKEMVRSEAQNYEADFARSKERFFEQDPTPSDSLRKCLDGLEQMIIGNVVWSLRCPRYHPEMRYDANAGIENRFLGTTPSAEDVRDACMKK